MIHTIRIWQTPVKPKVTEEYISREAFFDRLVELSTKGYTLKVYGYKADAFKGGVQ